MTILFALFGFVVFILTLLFKFNFMLAMKRWLLCIGIGFLIDLLILALAGLTFYAF